MSRRPKPTAIRKLEGNVGHHRILPGEEPKPQVGKPEMPKGMGTAAKRHWRRYVHNLMLLNVLTVVMVRHWSRRAAAQRWRRSTGTQ